MSVKETVGQIRSELPLVFWGVTLVIVLVAFTVLNPVVIVSAGYRGVVLTFSKVTGVMPEGINLRIPFVQSVRKIEIRTVKYEVQAPASSKDIQSVTSHIALNYHIGEKNVGELYREVGTDFESIIISPAIQESVKATTAKFVAQELIEKRESVSDGIKAMLIEKLNKWGIVVDALSIVNFDFTAEFSKAVEEKQVQAQVALKELNILEAVKAQARQKVEAATAEATAIRIQAQAVTQQGGKEYVALQWIKAWADGGSRVPQIVTADKGGAFIMNVKGMSTDDDK